MAFNPMQMMQAMMMNQLNGNPLFQQAQNMAQGKSPEQLKQTCENLCSPYASQNACLYGACGAGTV